MLNLIIHTRSFQETLLYDFFALFITLMATYLYASYKGSEELSEAETSQKISTMIMIIASLLPVLGVMPLDSVSRPIAYFALQGILAGIVAVLYGKGLLKPYAIVYYLILAIASIPVLVYYHNNFYPRYDVTKEPLYQTGTLEKYMEESAKGGFYYYIPVEAINNVAAAYLAGTGISLLLPAIRSALIYLILAITSVSLARRLQVPLLALVPLVYLTSPNLAFQYRIMAFPYAMILLYLTYLASQRRTLEATLLAAIIATTMVFTHPTGPLAMILLLASLSVIIYLVQAPEPLQRAVRNIFLLLSVIALTYWFTTYIYTLLVPKASRTTNALINFLNNLLGRKQVKEIILGETVNPYSAPGYSNPQFYTYAYNWATPVSLAALAITVGLWRLMRRKLHVNQSLTLAAAVTAIFYIAAAYIGYALNIEPGQYMIPIGYFAATLTIPIIRQHYRTRTTLAVIAIVLSLAVGLGAYSPSWAPLEHPDFKVSAKIHPFISYIEANLLKDKIDGITIFSDYSFPLGITGKTSYALINDLINNRLIHYKVKTFGLAKELLELILKNNKNINFNIVYMSNYHSIIVFA